jgi:hypothetical protein
MQIWSVRRRDFRYFKDIVRHSDSNIIGLLTSVRSKSLNQYHDFLYIGVL